MWNLVIKPWIKHMNLYTPKKSQHQYVREYAREYVSKVVKGLKLLSWLLFGLM